MAIIIDDVNQEFGIFAVELDNGIGLNETIDIDNNIIVVETQINLE